MDKIVNNERALEHSKSVIVSTFKMITTVCKNSEVKVSVFMSSLAAVAFFLQPNIFNTKIELISDFYNTTIKETVVEYLKPLSFSVDNELPVNLEITENPNYSFKYTSLGFYTKNLNFLEGLTKQEAEVKILNLIPKNLKLKAKSHIKSVLIICEKYQVDPLWVISVMWTESHFKPQARSHVGANGLMQIMPSTRKYLYRKMKSKGKSLLVESKDFKIDSYYNFHIKKKDFKKYVGKLVNIELGVVYLKRLLKSFNYNHKFATVAYNMGPGWARRRINSNQPIGNKNQYLDKIKRAYKYLVRRI